MSLTELKNIFLLWQIFGLMPFKVLKKPTEFRKSKFFEFLSIVNILASISLSIYFTIRYSELSNKISDNFQKIVDHTGTELAIVMLFAITSECYLMRNHQMLFLKKIKKIDKLFQQKFSINPKIFSIKNFINHLKNMWIISSFIIVFGVAYIFSTTRHGKKINKRFVIIYLIPVFHSTLQNIQFLIYIRLIIVRFKKFNEISNKIVDHFLLNGKIENFIEKQQKLQTILQFLTSSVNELNENNKFSLLAKNVDSAHRSLYVGALLFYVLLNTEIHFMKKMCLCLISTYLNTYIFTICCWNGYLLAEQVRND